LLEFDLPVYNHRLVFEKTEGALSRSFHAFLIVLFAGSWTIAKAAPQGLYGKSVVVSWTEDRTQRRNGGQALDYVTINGQLTVYISSAGRPFSRVTMSRTGLRGGLKTGNREAVGGEEGNGPQVDFKGNAFTVTKPMAGGARRILVSLDEGLQSCSAQVLTGKEEGSQKVEFQSIISGDHIELLSVKTGQASCKIENGNVFGG
jgi:hypothetical protein